MKDSRVMTHTMTMAGILLLLCAAGGCAGRQAEPPAPAASSKTCIQGTVWLRNPHDASPERYSGAKVTVWRHGTEEALGEAVADQDANYSIRIPMGGYRVDLRVWGLVMIRGRNHTCSMSVNNVDLGTVPRACGPDSIRIDIMTECREYIPSRRRR